MKTAAARIVCKTRKVSASRTLVFGQVLENGEERNFVLVVSTAALVALRDITPLIRYLAVNGCFQLTPAHVVSTVTGFGSPVYHVKALDQWDIREIKFWGRIGF